MDIIQNLLGVLAEECAEVAQRASKGQRFGLEQRQPGQDQTNHARLRDEIIDLFAVAQLIEAETGFQILPRANSNADQNALRNKQVKVIRYAAAKTPEEIAALDAEYIR